MSMQCYSIIIVLLFLINERICITVTNDNYDSISAILESYARAYTTTNEPTRRYSHVAPQTRSISTADVNNFDYAHPSPGYVYTFATAPTTIKPLQKLVHQTSTNPSIEQKVADTKNLIRKNSDDDYSSTSSFEESEEGDPEGPPDHEIPYSEHEDPKEPSTRPNYTAPGVWARPPPDKNISLDFVPTKLYAQVRGTHTVKHVPKEEAINSAETSEEKENAARLREVVKVTKANTVYTEEGYEDAAYDHAGQIRDANFHENISRKGKGNSKRKINGKKKYKHKPKRWKSKPLKSTNYDDDDVSENFSGSVVESAEEARLSKVEVKPEDLNVLKSALDTPVIRPKSVVENGIAKLEEDLRKASSEIENVAIDPYTSTSTTTTTTTTTTLPTLSTIVVKEITNQNKTIEEVTTIKPYVYTIRPRKPTTLGTSAQPKLFSAKIRIPNRYVPILKKSDAYNSYASELPGISTTTQLWGHLNNGQDQTSTTSQTNPFAVATVNGHGPYLVMVSSTPHPFTSNPLDKQGFETTIGRVSIPSETTKKTLNYSNIERKPFLATKVRNVEVTSKGNIPQFSYTVKNRDLLGRKENRNDESDIDFDFPKALLADNLTDVSDYVNSEYDDDDLGYFSVMRPPTLSEPVVPYDKYLLNPQKNATLQEQESQGSKKPLKNGYEVVENVNSPNNEAMSQIVPVTKLLPPAPLSGSEYVSFLMRDRNKNVPNVPKVMTVMPLVRLLRQREPVKNTIPFYFRKKRSTDILQINKNSNESRTNSIARSETKSESAISNSKFPAKFLVLLNEPQKIAGESVNKEIDKRFNNSSKKMSENISKKSKEVTGEVSDLSSNEKSSSESTEASREDNGKGNFEKEKGSVEVEVPELDFSNVFEEDEIEPTTKKAEINVEKYPFYNKQGMESTALQYIMNPMKIPRKTLGGMEFYNSRRLECDEEDPDLENIAPEDEELENQRGPSDGKPRLNGLGDKLDCFKAKFFDENPLDNPLFLEKDIGSPSPPLELDPKKFAARILRMPSEKEEYIIPRGPKFPESYTSMNQASSKNIPKYVLRYNPSNRTRIVKLAKNLYKSNQKSPGYPINDRNRLRLNKTAPKLKIKVSPSKVLPMYQHFVYEDVMGIIKNSTNNRKPQKIKQNYKYSNYHSKEYNAKDTNKKNTLIRQTPVDIAGLVPPPKYALILMPYKTMHSNKRRPPYNLYKTLTQNKRVFKRNVNLSDIEEEKNVSDQANSTIEDDKKTTFRIILTTPLPKTEKPKKKVKTFISTKSTLSTQTTVSNSNHSEPANYPSTLGRHDKFYIKKKSNSSMDLRRKEPRYNDPPQKNSSTNNANTTVSDFITSKVPKVSLEFNADTNISGSTLIPVIVQPVDSRIKEPKDDQDVKNTKKQNQVTKNNEEDKKDVDDDEVEIVSEYHEGVDSKEHKELLDFLKGDPPGYKKAFGKDSSTEGEQNDKVKDLTQEESKDNRSTEEADQSGEQNDSKEVKAEESSAESVEAQPNENDQPQSGEETAKSNSQESDDEPFERFSERPYSPPENYEDPRYSDLGPRVNKPCFYHPPFDGPDYEKRASRKVADSYDDDDDDEYGHSEETERTERFLFPWEHEEDDEKSEESRHYARSNRYGYPWEERERKQKGRRRREKSRQKYRPDYSDEDNENDEEATNAKLIYVPLKKKHLRGKKDLNNHPYPGKFSSRYKSGSIKIPLKDEIIFSSTNNRAIKKSVGDSINKNFTTPKSLPLNRADKFKFTRTRNSLPQDNSTTLKYLRNYMTTTTPLSSYNATTKYPNRTRSRHNIFDRISNVRSLDVNNNTSTPAPSTIRRRGRNKNNSTTTSTTISPNNTTIRRRRTRLTMSSPSTTSPSLATTLKTVNNWQRRPLSSRRIMTNNRNSSITSQNDSATLPSISTSTEKTIEHHSHISKKQIITKTFYPDEDEDVDDDDEDQHEDEQIEKPDDNSKLKRRRRPKNNADEKYGTKEKVEKITITMEETPNHVYKTKEIDKDGVRGKFVTIIANNHSTTPANQIDDFRVSDQEMEEMKSNMSVIGDLANKPSKFHDTENPILNNKTAIDSNVNASLSERSSKNDTDDNGNTNENDENDEDYDVNEDDDYDTSGEDNDEDDDEGDEEGETEDDEKNEENGKVEANDEKAEEKNLTTTSNPAIIKDPNSRQYFYVE